MGGTADEWRHRERTGGGGGNKEVMANKHERPNEQDDSKWAGGSAEERWGHERPAVPLDARKERPLRRRRGDGETEEQTAEGRRGATWRIEAEN